MLPAIFLSASAAFAGTGDAHTWHNVYSKNGTWKGTLQTINEDASFVAEDGSPISSFTVSEASPQKFGFIYGEDSDFDVAYTLTLTQNQLELFTSKTCVFVITAKGPAQPDIRTEPYNGATCQWTLVPGVGEDFYVE